MSTIVVLLDNQGIEWERERERERAGEKIIYGWENCRKLHLRTDDRDDSVNAVCFTRTYCDANSAVIESLSGH